MKISPITSETNQLLKRIRGLRQRSMREKTGLFLAEGAKLVAEAVSKGVRVKDVLVSQSFLKEGLGDSHAANIAAVSVVEDRLFAEVTTTEGPCGIVAVAEMPRWSPEQLFSGRAPLVVIADAIQDPGNLGTMIRTALAASASGLILTKGCVDPFNPKVVRSAAGSLFTLPHVGDLAIDHAIDLVKQHGLRVIACDPAAARMHWDVDLTTPVALAFGNEGQGFSPRVLARADESVAIPMGAASESLNVAVAAGIILFSAVQQRLTMTGPRAG